VSFAAAITLAFIITGEADPRFMGKLRLVITQRVRRILGAAAGLYVALFVVELCIVWQLSSEYLVPILWALQIVSFQLVPYILVVAIRILSVDEKRRQSRYLKEAESLVTRLDPYVIGITGSYGKSSVKNMLGELLQITHKATFWPPKGVNTLMGVTAAIRNSLRPEHVTAVVEMAAYRRGSIRKLCELTPPKAGIITAIGIMHLERFGSPEEIYRAKTELAQSIPADGILVCNGDDTNARRAAEEFSKQTTLLYGFDNSKGDLACHIKEIVIKEDGTHFELVHLGKSYKSDTGLLGRPALSNAMASFTMACALGADPNFVLGAIRNLKPLDNRLSIRKNGEVTYIMDAYNSNPIGFTAALEVLGAYPAQRRFLFTPGMIELGERQFEENKRAAQAAAAVCDKIFLIGPENREALHAGLREAQYSEENIVFCDTRDIGFELLHGLVSNGDVILVENDLTDLYEGEERF
ncbi:MAG: UDP-N-acetylmuramoyl-tripeptide--D-alanyl-D-alanine ligase, partial [Bdellovibrionales bacterium]|nr:UDP-N-acetylmuramoyl-tripeptide--D-alanyl-D-alanine ligase [Bdellovibrionales bacterium]